MSYVQHEALLWEYHKKAMELMDTDMRAVLKTLYSEEGYKGSMNWFVLAIGKGP